MQAVVFKEPFRVVLEERPIPTIQHPTDVVVKVQYTALCGSELHVYRGHQPSGANFIMGHEFIGEVWETGSAIKNFRKGDDVIAPFTTSCGVCFYCSRSMSSRCVESKLFGSPVLDGGQAEYVRVPLADSSLFQTPEAIDKIKLVFMADIFPTGYFAALNAFKGIDEKEINNSTVLVFGCGPVGLFALINALPYRPGHVLAIDKVTSRLQEAEKLGAEAWNYEKDEQGLKDRVMELTNGRGADIVIEVVGHSDALRMGFDLLRPFGRISSVGVHNENLPWTGFEAYSKNLSIQLGRCPVRSIFPEALAEFVRNQSLYEPLTTDIRPLSQAPQSFEDFHLMKSQKIIFEAGK